MANWIQSGTLWIDSDSGNISTLDPTNLATGDLAAKWGADAVVSADGRSVYLPSQNINVPINADGTQDMVRSTQNSGNVITNSLTGLAGSELGSVLTGRALLQGGVQEQDMSSAGILDVFGSPATAGTEYQDEAQLAAQLYGGYMAGGALSNFIGGAGAAGGSGDVLAGAGDMFGSGAAYEAGVTGLGNAAAGGTGTVSAGAFEGGGMDWWDQLLMETGEAGVDASSLEGGFNSYGGADLFGETGAFDQFGWGNPDGSSGAMDAMFGGAGAGGSGMSAADLLRGGSLARGLLGGAGDIMGGLGRFLPSADNALAMAPILAAIAYARNQGGFDTSRLEDTYNQFDPNTVAYEYDQNTVRGREGLNSSLTNRGVMGSSFGNNDITNFNTTRDMGRRSLINQGVLARADPAKSILDAQIKERAIKNNLYGQSLLAMGNVFGGRK
jgi:hypothetical protein